jgi:hypothetical protein
MAKDPAKTSLDSLSLPADDMMELTLVVNELLGAEASINPYQVRNSKALSAAKGLVCYKNGVTKQPMSVKRLKADALEKRDHSLALSGNMQLARSEMQIQGTDAHHIVSRTHKLARFSRDYLFAWRIGIDDADNGVFLPEQFGMNIPGLEKANAHSPIHSGLYHTEVASRLLLRRREPASAGRAELRAMREEMIAGSFPYKKAKK